MGPLLRLQHYQRCEPMILKIWVKTKFALCQHVIITYLPIEKYKTNHVFEVLTSLKTYSYCQSQEILFKHHLKMTCFGEILHCQIQLL